METRKAEDQEIINLVKKYGPDPRKIVKALGYSLVKAKHKIIALNLQDGYQTVFTERHGGFGRPELQPFIISRRKAMNPKWPPCDLQKITVARHKFDRGEIEMPTGRDGDWYILYSIPRSKVDKHRRPYFSAKRLDDV